MSSLTGEGVELLYRTILHVTLEQPYIGELIPESWLKTGRAIVNKRKTASLLNWTAVETQVSQNNESCSLKHGQNAGEPMRCDSIALLLISCWSHALAPDISNFLSC